MTGREHTEKAGWPRQAGRLRSPSRDRLYHRSNPAVSWTSHHRSIVGIAGGTSSGKTTVTRSIARRSGSSVALSCITMRTTRISPHSAGKPSRGDQFRSSRCLRHAALRRASGRAPSGDGRGAAGVQLHHLQANGRDARVEPRPMIMLEGILIFAEAAFVSSSTSRCSCDTDDDERVLRRIRRDVLERGRTVEWVMHQYVTTVKPMHLEFVEPSKRWADVIIPRGGENRVAVDMVVARLRLSAPRFLDSPAPIGIFSLILPAAFELLHRPTPGECMLRDSQGYRPSTPSRTPLFRKTVLDNGIRVVTETIPHVRSVSIGIWADVGSRDETTTQNGISHFLEHMVFKGTRNRNVRDIAQSLESLGGYLNAFTTKEQTCFYARVLDANVSPGDGRSFRPRSQRHVQEGGAGEGKAGGDRGAEERGGRPRRHHPRLFREGAVFPSLPRVSDHRNRGESPAVRHGRICGHMSARHYRPVRMVVAAAGNVDHEDLVRLVRETLSVASASRGAPPKRRPGPSAARNGILERVRTTHQAGARLPGNPRLQHQPQAIGIRCW